MESSDDEIIENYIDDAEIENESAEKNLSKVKSNNIKKIPKNKNELSKENPKQKPKQNNPEIKTVKVQLIIIIVIIIQNKLQKINK